MSKAKLSDRIGKFTAVPNRLLTDMTITHQARWLFTILRTYADDNDIAFPSLDTLHALSGLTRKSIVKSVRELERHGWIDRQRRFANSTIYTLRYPTISSESLLMDTATISSESTLPLVANRHCISVDSHPLTRLSELDNIDKSDASAPHTDKPATAAIIPARVSDPLTHAFDRNVKQLDPLKIINAWRGATASIDMCCMFVEVFGAEVQRGDKGKWLSGAARLAELNATKAELVAVRDAVAREGGALTHPGAAYEWVKGVRARTKNKPTAAVSIPAPAGTRYVAVPAKAVQYDD